MNRLMRYLAVRGQRGAFMAGTVAFALVATVAHAQMYRPDPTPGGIDAVPRMVTVTKTATNALVRWHGAPGAYQIQMTPTLNPANWSDAAHVTCDRYSNGIIFSNLTAPESYFRVQMPANSYIGSGGCSGCHGARYDQWRETRHCTAYAAIAGMPPSQRQACLVCHTVGVGQPSGFTDMTNTPHLGDVGCENCHGPAGAHKYGDHDLVRPIVTVAAEVCGGCHTGSHHPTYNEWTNSPHAEVTEHVREYFLDSDPVVGLQRQMSCGPCHSGATRVALLNDVRARSASTNSIAGITAITAGVTNYLVLPSANDAADFGQTCVTCHDPHDKCNDAQLRNPKFSAHFFTLPTTYVQTNVVTTNFNGVRTTNMYFANTVFATNYDATIQICGQCHNTRGADWTSSSRPPHRSPQYNLLIGAIQPGYLNGTNVQQIVGSRSGVDLTAIGAHGRNSNGCAQCHMHRLTVDSPTDANPNDTGHNFRARMDGCTAAGCHSSTNEALGLQLGLAQETSHAIAQLVATLGVWATNKAPSITNAFSAYGSYAWEYTSAGQLSNPTGTNTMPGSTNLIAGPPSALQGRIPATIKQARFDLYMVENDASLGVHNPAYVRYLMNHAVSNVTWQLSQP